MFRITAKTKKNFLVLQNTFLFHGTGRGRSLELSVDHSRTNYSSPDTDLSLTLVTQATTAKRLHCYHNGQISKVTDKLKIGSQQLVYSYKFKHFLFTSMTQKAQRTRRRGCWRSVVMRGGGNRRTWGKPPTLDERSLPCHMPTPGFDPGLQRWQASALTTALSRPPDQEQQLVDRSL